MDNYKIGFIGMGNMAQAILFGMLDKGIVSEKNIYAHDVLAATLDKVVGKTGINPLASNPEVVKTCDMIFLAVKPNYCKDVLVEVGEFLADKALLSFVSGWSFEDIREFTADSMRLLVVQPNTPFMVGAGMTNFAKTTSFTKEELEMAKKIFGTQGLVEVVPDELLMFCGTSSAAVPAFAYTFIEALADASVEDGIPRDLAYKLCAAAVMGAGKMVLESGLHPGILKDQVTSPGGSTIRGIHALEKGGFRGTAMDAVKAANDRWRK
jgi:pyrroline-5-carboxylate reductase